MVFISCGIHIYLWKPELTELPEVPVNSSFILWFSYATFGRDYIFWRFAEFYLAYFPLIYSRLKPHSGKCVQFPFRVSLIFHRFAFPKTLLISRSFIEFSYLYLYTWNLETIHRHVWDDCKVFMYFLRI